jgi:alkylation response protein AidB-like acyl-CoA dehydrogenase
MATTAVSASPPDRVITKSELKRHSTEDDCWVQIGNRVLNVSTFKFGHPGGEKILTKYAGQDATEQFYALHRHEVLEKYLGKLQVGVIENGMHEEPSNLGEISEVPFAEHIAWRDYDSPYFTESHIELRESFREWLHVRCRLSGIAEHHENTGERVPDDLMQDMGMRGIHAARLGPGPHLKQWRELVAKDPAATIFGVEVEDFDYFHEQIMHEEMGRLGCGGFIAGVGDGMVIGLPAVNQFGQAWMKADVVPEVLSGRKRISLAITEPQAGSDVANIITTATLSADGTHYLVNGTKKWITGGCHADYFVCAVRTGPAGGGGISILLLERGMEGLETKPIKTAYSAAAGTALVILEDVKVPISHLIGKENNGFMCVMYNFNHERWFICALVMGIIRAIVEETFKWTMQRRAFGKRLADQGVVRQKLAVMISAMEPCAHWLDSITHQMNRMPYEMQGLRLAGTTSLLKYQTTRAAQICADNAVQLWGGRGITKQGMGRYVERFNSQNKLGAILGGSEEILADLGVKMALKAYPNNARL